MKPSATLTGKGAKSSPPLQRPWESALLAVAIRNNLQDNRIAEPTGLNSLLTYYALRGIIVATVPLLNVPTVGQAA